MNEDQIRIDALQWVTNIDPLQVCPFDNRGILQRYILAVLYYSTGGDEWSTCGGKAGTPCDGSERFLSKADVCSWHGMLCSDNDLTEITLGKYCQKQVLLIHFHIKISRNFIFIMQIKM